MGGLWSVIALKSQVALGTSPGIVVVPRVRLPNAEAAGGESENPRVLGVRGISGRGPHPCFLSGLGFCPPRLPPGTCAILRRPTGTCRPSGSSLGAGSSLCHP